MPGPLGFEHTAIWSGQPMELDGHAFNPLLETVRSHLAKRDRKAELKTRSCCPTSATSSTAVAQLGQDIFNDFDPFIQGSFVYWGADTLYSIPSLISGLVHDVSLGLIPNEFALLNNGAEPLSGYTDGPGSLPQGLANGLQFLRWHRRYRWRSWPARIPGPQHMGARRCNRGGGRQPAAAASTDAGNAVRDRWATTPDCWPTSARSCPTSPPTSRRCSPSSQRTSVPGSPTWQRR